MSFKCVGVALIIGVLAMSVGAPSAAAKNGDTAATTEEATAVYQMSKLMC